MMEDMWKTINIIVNVAANTKFDERYDVALDVNTFGSKNVLDFAKKCEAGDASPCHNWCPTLEGCEVSQ
ncbi:Fatty acyl-coa reductase [Thalictrum thalictroides]|uniref:Fatty acyl-CoA reductase n=1 Tax=Thalictrum thalictroides TaxID=46969 RepID=A0A7J6UVU9_THATH|nr:Fatty acyl-coa reductase [Thalictrum thalictroides]